MRLSPCFTLDLRKSESSQAAKLLKEHLLGPSPPPTLVKSGRPWSSLGLRFTAPIPIVDGPSAYYWVHLDSGPCEDYGELFRTDAKKLLAGFRPLVMMASQGSEECLPAAASYRSRIENHVKRQIEADFPRLDWFLQDNRLTRELTYEHEGLLHGLLRLEPHLRQLLNGLSTRKEREKLELDVHHLLEHHLEREERGLVPLLGYIHQRTGLPPPGG